MKTPASAASAGLDLHHPPDFSLVLGGSLFQLLRRTHLADDALLVVRRRIMVIALFAWLPLLLLSALEGNLRGGSTGVPFLFDIEVHVRFLVTLPLLVLAELVVHQRMRPLLQQFVERNLTPENATARFEAAIVRRFACATRCLPNCCRSPSCMGSVSRSSGAISSHSTRRPGTRQGRPEARSFHLPECGSVTSACRSSSFSCAAGISACSSGRFLWQVSRIELRLLPTHPDRLGGLSFISGQI